MTKVRTEVELTTLNVEGLNGLIEYEFLDFYEFVMYSKVCENVLSVE